MVRCIGSSHRALSQLLSQLTPDRTHPIWKRCSCDGCRGSTISPAMKPHWQASIHCRQKRSRS